MVRRLIVGVIIRAPRGVLQVDVRPDGRRPGLDGGLPVRQGRARARRGLEQGAMWTCPFAKIMDSTLPTLVLGTRRIHALHRRQSAPRPPLDGQLVAVFTLAPRTSPLLVPADQVPPKRGRAGRRKVAVLATDRGRVAEHVGRLGLHYAGDDPAVDAVPEADRPAPHLSFLLRAHSDVPVYPSVEAAERAGYRADRVQGMWLVYYVCYPCSDVVFPSTFSSVASIPTWTTQRCAT